MLNIECDNPELTRLLAQLCLEVEKCGGIFNESLLLKALNGDFGFYSNLPRDDSRILISIPEAAFIPFDKVELKLDGNNIVISSGEENLPPATANLLRIIVRVYNLTNKIQKYRRFSPRVAFQEDADLLQKLAEARAGTPVQKRVLDFIGADEKKREKFIIKSFLRTRNFKTRVAQNTIVPFIDFANHNTMAFPFNRRVDEQKGFCLEFKNSKPVKDENQCYARYGRWDSHDTYLMFGFSSATQAFFRSVPMEIDLQEIGTIRVKANLSANRQNKLPKEIEDLSKFFPPVRRVSEKALEVSTLLIPSLNWPYALKRILVTVVSTLAPDLPIEEKQIRAANAEFQIIRKNLEYYSELMKILESKKEKFGSAPAFKEAVKMAKIQIGHIKAYENYFIEKANQANKVSGAV